MPVRANTIAVAAGIAPCVEEVVQAYIKAGGDDFILVKEACGPLARQIKSGAPYELFLASEPRWPKWLQDQGLLVDVHTFAMGQLVLWHDLAEEVPNEEMIKTAFVAIPDPETTAYGYLAKEYLEQKGLWDKMLAENRIIFVGNAPQAVLAAKGGIVQIAFLPLSMAIKAGGSYKELSGMNIDQVGGLTPKASDECSRFWVFCRSQTAAPIWIKWGFLLPNDEEERMKK
ncbi:MAG: molybdate ABC transporter substrate-binding protein [Thermovirgaceae bacterium]